MTSEKMSKLDVETRTLYRSYSLAYKLKILEEMENSLDRGDITRIAERENLDRPMLYKWQREKKAGKLKGSKGNSSKNELPETDRLRKENAILVEELRKAKSIIEIQKKISDLLSPQIQDQK